jgi:hypothetical protein
VGGKGQRKRKGFKGCKEIHDGQNIRSERGWRGIVALATILGKLRIMEDLVSLIRHLDFIIKIRCHGRGVS